MIFSPQAVIVQEQSPRDEDHICQLEVRDSSRSSLNLEPEGF